MIANINDIPRIAGLYIKNAINDFGFSSIVTAVVAGYRAFDTMFENVVIFTACYWFYTLLSSVKLNNMDDKFITDDELYNYDTNQKQKEIVANKDCLNKVVA